MAEDASWREWLAAAQQGDRRAYGAVLAAVLPWLRGRARRRWPQSGTAEIEDIVQETVLALHLNLHLYDPSRPAEPFIYGIMKLRGADVRRRRARHATREARLDDLAVTEPALATKAGQEREMDVRTATAALQQLPARDRDLLVLLKLRETRLRDAAAITDMSIPALKVATFRAMRRLRRAMGTDDGD